MKYAVSFLLLSAVAACGEDTTPAAGQTPAKPDTRVIEQIVAKVNGEIVTQGELERARAQLVNDLGQQRLPPDRVERLLKDGEANLLRNKIDTLLLVQKAKDLGISVDQDVSKYLAQLQLDSGIKDVDKFHDAVREQTGMSFEDYKAQIRDGFLTREVIRREVGSRIVVSQADQMKYYEEHKKDFVREEQLMLREILVSTTGKDAQGIAAAEKKAKDLVARARKGENFANLAHDNSDADTAPNYGELPPFKRGMLKQEIEDAVFSQPRGYITDPIRQANGFLILKVEEHYQAGQQPFEAVQNEIMDRLYMPQMEPKIRAYLTKLRQEAFLELRAGFVDSGAAPGKDTSWRDPARLTPQTVTKEEVIARARRKRLLWMIPVPGTKIGGEITPKPPTASAGPGTPAAAGSPAPAGTPK